jgi:hypothetical protein
MEYKLELTELLVKHLAPDKIVEISCEDIIINIPDADNFSISSESLAKNIELLAKEIRSEPVPVTITIKNSINSKDYIYNLK